ncbi:MAG: S46 family peptidase [Bacteroidia bacterium]|jgi:V8-like Glu-specific endopeptidase|nr:S46 family peptidase [Bacteroidia bacterium]
MKKRILSLFVAIAGVFSLHADEGMWPLVMLQKIQDPMQAAGLKLTAEDIYSINKASVKDGVVRLMSKGGRMFCTGEVISSQGLFLTNHHCGYGAIAALSTNDDNILSNGFWAKSKAEERPANFNIGFLRKIEDVTQKVLDGIAINQDEAGRATAVTAKIKEIQKALVDALGEDKANYSVEVTSFYNGNQYLAMYYEVYRDIRLVGTPPENVGKFGGETDNWRWPRHTCDFSMFRIYAGTNNKPSDYAAANSVYKAEKYFPVSLKGYEDGDFSMIMGYPGRTTRYTYSEGIKYLSSKERPMRVQLRRDIMDVYESYMKVDKVVRLQYSDKLAGLGNYWNKFKGEAADLSKPGLYEKRKAAELDFEKWVRTNDKGSIYGDVTGLYDEAYRMLNEYGLYPVYLQDGVNNSQVMAFALQMYGLDGQLNDKEKAAAAKEGLLKKAEGINGMFANFYDPIEKKVLAAVIRRMSEDLDHKYLPALLNELVAKYNRDYDKVADALWKKSMYSNKEKLAKFLKNPSAKALLKDPIFNIVNAYMNTLTKDLKPKYDEINSKLDRANRLFLSAALQMDSQKAWAPDANATMRLTYGHIMNYEPRDGVHNKTFTTAKGYTEKYIPGDFEFDAPVALLELIRKKDYGQYADKDGELHTCFLSNNDITGGNSGSPVINANGELIGIAFDGNYEAISSDFMFMPETQRTISVDIRFVLFIIDKFGGAKNIVDEMTLVK